MSNSFLEIRQTSVVPSNIGFEAELRSFPTADLSEGLLGRLASTLCGINCQTLVQWISSMIMELRHFPAHKITLALPC